MSTVYIATVVLVILVALKSIYIAYVELFNSTSFMAETFFGHTK